MRLVAHRRHWIAVVALVAAVSTSACAEAPSDEHVIDEPATVEEIGADETRITLTEQAAERLAIETAPVERAGGQTVVPSGALMLDPAGVYWVYTNPSPLVFVPQQVTLDREDDDGRAYLVEGPLAGTDVVTLGAAELYGIEHGIGH
jgi:hypothetical protein